MGATKVDGMQLGRRFRVGLLCGSETLGDDSKHHWECHFEQILVNRGVAIRLIKTGITLLCKKGGCFLKFYKEGGIYNCKKYGLTGMRHKMPTYMWPKDNRTLSGFFYSNFINLLSVFRQLDIIN